MSKYIPPSKRNNIDLSKGPIKEHKTHVNTDMKPIKNKKTDIKLSISIINSNNDFPPLSNIIVKRDHQLGAWKNKITITNEPVPNPKLSTSSSSSNNNKNVKSMKKISYYDDHEIVDDFEYDRHTYTIEEDYYDSD